MDLGYILKIEGMGLTIDWMLAWKKKGVQVRIMYMLSWITVGGSSFQFTNKEKSQRKTEIKNSAKRI